MFYIVIIIVIVGVVISVISAKVPDHKYKAEFGNYHDHLSIWNKGFALGSRAFPRKLSCTNFFLSGPTGSGKSSLVTIPCAVSLSRGRNSIIFNDINGELYHRTSKYLATKGYKILRLNFTDSRYSETFNPLVECKSISDIQKLALIIIQNVNGESKNSDPFWDNSSVMLLSLFARYLVFHQPLEYRTLQNLQRLIEKFAVNSNDSIDRLFAKTKDEGLLDGYKATISMGDRTMQSVIASARTALHLWSDPEIAKTTATNSIDFNLLRQERMAIFVSNPLKDLRYLKPLSALFFQSLFNFVLSRIPDRKENFIYFVLDEFSSYRFPDVALTVSQIRKTNSGMLIAIQDEMSLVSQYGQAEAHQIKTNCGIQCYLKGQPLYTCKELSQILGKYSYEEEKGGRTRERELMTPDEIRKTDSALILINNKAPIKYLPTPYFKSFWLRRLAYAEPLTMEPKTVAEPPLLKFD